MKPCDIINEKPVIPEGETQCLFGNLVYVRVEAHDSWEGVGFFIAFISFLLFLTWLIRMSYLNDRGR